MTASDTIGRSSGVKKTIGAPLLCSLGIPDVCPISWQGCDYSAGSVFISITNLYFTSLATIRS